MKKIISILALLYSPLILSNEIIIDPGEDSLDEFLDEDIDFQRIDSLGDEIDISDKKYRAYKPKEFKRVSPQKPDSFYAALGKKSKLVEIDTGKIFFNEKKLYVRAKEVYFGGKWSYLISKNGEMKYKTYTRNLTSIEDVMNIRTTIPGDKVYPPKTSHHTSDKVFPIDTHFLYRTETSNLSYIGQNLGFSDGNANSSTFSAKFYYKSFLPINFGLVFDYQVGTFNFEESEDAGWNAFFIGPTIKYDIYDRKSFNFNTQLAVKKSMFFNARQNGETANFSSLLWQVGLEAVYKTSLGNFSLGYESSSIRSSVKSELPNQGPIQTEKETMFQNSITMGYQFSWNL